MGQTLSYFNDETTKTTRKYGCIKDTSCDTDQYHNLTLHESLEYTNYVDLRSRCPPVYDQGALGSCTANAVAGAYQFDEIKEGETDIFTPSRLFIYYNERVIEGTVDQDSGAQLRDGIKTINATGVCPETMWPYDTDRFANTPPSECYEDAKNHKCVAYKRLEQDLNQFKQCLLQGLPFVFGFIVYESFETKEVAKTGNVPMPDPNTEKILGRHAVMCVGYDAEKQVFIVRNSWSESWGDQGYCYMPFDYLTNIDLQLASDFWTVEIVKDTETLN